MVTWIKGDYFVVPDKIFGHPIGKEAKLIFFYLCCCAEMNGSSVQAYSKIMEACGIGNRNTVTKALKELVETGLIKKESRKWENGGRASNMYWICE